MVKIPIIDFSLFTDGNITARQTVVKQIFQACHEIGFMYLENPGISPDLIQQIFQQSRYFFSLPLEAKQQLAWSDEFSNQGYVGIERERLDPNKPGDLKEAFNISNPQDGEIEKQIYHSAIPTFYQTCTEVANSVLQAFALALQLPEDFFAKNHNQQNHTLRLLHYPPLQQLPKPGQVRAGEHSDYGSITLLFQDKIGGLEVQTATPDHSPASRGEIRKFLSQEWIPAPTIPGTVIVNTGDLMQRWTNHVFCSTKHRVMIPADERVNQSRYSIAFFCHPNNDTEIACLDCQNQHPPIYPPILAGEYLLSRLQATY